MPLRALVVVESAFGNTDRIARAVAEGLASAGVDGTVAAASAAPDAPAAEGFGLVVVGAPTHNLGLPTPRSRVQAGRRGAPVPTTGVAEWLDARPALAGVRTAAFDTVLPGRFSGSASRRIAARLRRLGAPAVAREGFLVSGTPPVLADGELDRARAWGAALAGAGS